MQERRALVATLSGPVRRRAAVGTVAAAVVALDQVTKTLAENGLRPGPTTPAYHHVFASLYLVLTYNSGAAFGIGRGVTPVVEVVVVVLVAGLLVFGRRAVDGASGPVAVGLGLLVGGALGNLVDRFVRHNGGRVIDFIDIARIGGRDWWPIFNVADSAIVVGAILLVFTYARSGKGSPAPARHG